MSHVHCCVRDLQAAARWFEQVGQVVPVVHNERMAWLGFGEFGVILDAAPTDSVFTLACDSDDCDADYRTVTGRGAETIEAPQDRPWIKVPSRGNPVWPAQECSEDHGPIACAQYRMVGEPD